MGAKRFRGENKGDALFSMGPMPCSDSQHASLWFRDLGFSSEPHLRKRSRVQGSAEARDSVFCSAQTTSSFHDNNSPSTAASHHLSPRPRHVSHCSSIYFTLSLFSHAGKARTFAQLCKPLCSLTQSHSTHKTTGTFHSIHRSLCRNRRLLY